MARTGLVRAVNVVLLVQISWSSLVVAQFGMGLGGMGMGFGGFGMGNMFGPDSSLGRAVRAMVHQDARPSQAMIDIAMRHRRGPRTRAEMQEYTPHMVLLAYQHGVKPNGTTGEPSLDVMTNYILERGRKYQQSRGLPQAATPAPAPAPVPVIPSQPISQSSAPTGGANPVSTGISNSATFGFAPAPAPGENTGTVAATGTVAQPHTVNTAGQSAAPSVPAYNIAGAQNSFLDNYLLMQMMGQEGFGLF